MHITSITDIAWKGLFGQELAQNGEKIAQYSFSHLFIERCNFWGASIYQIGIQVSKKVDKFDDQSQFVLIWHFHSCCQGNSMSSMLARLHYTALVEQRRAAEQRKTEKSRGCITVVRAAAHPLTQKLCFQSEIWPAPLQTCARSSDDAYWEKYLLLWESRQKMNYYSDNLI